MTAQTALHIPIDHPAFAGHFPGSPIVPGVVLLDEALHAIASARGLSLATCQLNSVKFLSPLTPGVAVLLTYEVQSNGSIHFDIMAETRKIASGSVLINKTT
jgi:3-hydroxyacyl-[acyl-carrier-protein] dehydratase